MRAIEDAQQYFAAAAKDRTADFWYRRVHQEGELPLRPAGTLEPPHPWHYGDPCQTIRLGSTYAASFPGASVMDYDNHLALITEANELLLDADYSQARPYYRGLLETETLPPLVQVKGSALFLAGRHSNNYWHWLYNFVPLLAVAKEAGLTLTDYDCLLVHNLRGGYTRELLAAAGPLPPLLEVSRCRHIQFSKVHVVADPGDERAPSPWRLSFLRNLFLRDAPRTSGGRLIYISRRRAARNLSNELEVIGCLSELGFEIIELEGRTVQEQANLFNEASCVVAAHGSALGNTVFCRPGTRVVEILSPNYVVDYFRPLCGALNLDYFYLIGDGPIPATEIPTTHHLNFPVSLDKLRATLHLAGISLRQSPIQVPHSAANRQAPPTEPAAREQQPPRPANQDNPNPRAKPAMSPQAHSPRSGRPRVLLLTLEFQRWAAARYWSYPIGIGLEDGLKANGMDYLTLPIHYECPSSEPHSLFSHARRLLANQTFDQVWLEAIHSPLAEADLEWLAKLAPVRLGFLVESTEIRAEEEANNPVGTARRRENLARALPFLTHLAAVDEQDAKRFTDQGRPAMWWPATVPANFVTPTSSLPKDAPALFFGALYGPRAEWLKHPSVKDLLRRPASPEDATDLPAKYDRFHSELLARAQKGESGGSALLDSYTQGWRGIRRELFSVWLQGLGSGSAVVNLHHPTEIYSGRVFEAMAAGRPVVSFAIQNRPRTEKLFRPGNEILTYTRGNIEELAQRLLELRETPDRARAIASRARENLVRLHTTEQRVAQYLQWLETGREPQLDACDTAAAPTRSPETAVAAELQPAPETQQNDLARLRQKNLWQPQQCLRLHLGCGEQRLDGYINIDYPASEHSVMKVQPDYTADITRLEFPPGSVDEIRLHHVFEHFSRVTALAQLIRWHGWLKPGGRLHIETPDLMGSARTLVSDASLRVKMGVTRHLAGDQAARWAYHVDHWFPDRFQHTLVSLGFDNIRTRSASWSKEPYLSNVEVVATKTGNQTEAELLAIADRLLWESTVADVERPTWEVWRRQLRETLAGSDPQSPANVTRATTSAPDDLPAPPSLPELRSDVPLSVIHHFNQNDRDAWVRAKAATIPPGARVLDVGAGTCPYRQLFRHCDYVTHDFKKYEGVKLGDTTDYGRIDLVSDITSIPAPDHSFDAILCTEVLEHVPEPIGALAEMARLLKPGGRLLITAPLGSGLHQEPYHYYGGYTPHWYRHFAQRLGLEVTEVTPNGGFFKLLAQECARVAWTWDKHAHLHGANGDKVRQLFGEWLPRYLWRLEGQYHNPQFTVGYHVEMTPVAKAVVAAQSKAIAESTPAPASPNAAPPTRPGSIGAAKSDVVVVVFSKDRPMQLDATLRSFALHCRDREQAALHVLYAASDGAMGRLYEQLGREHPNASFVLETNFKSDLVRLTRQHRHVLFLVDDNLFVSDFALAGMAEALTQQPGALGFSLRLGRNTTYCYPFDRDQALPEFTAGRQGILCYDWTRAQLDFNYPLEVSSSLYRVSELLPLLEGLNYRNPNTLEDQLAGTATTWASRQPELLCFEKSVTFCAPINRVQDVCRNRAGSVEGQSAKALADQFVRGVRLQVERYTGFTPKGCHEEVPLHLSEPRSGGSRPKVSVVIPCFKQAHYLPEAVESVVAQSYRDWEVIIVDDGSPDDTSEVANQLMLRFAAAKIRLVRKPNGGLSDARNAGIRVAQGEYVLPLDADDQIHPQMLEKTVALLEADPNLEVIYTDQLHFGAVSRYVGMLEFNREALLWNNLLGYCSLYRKRLWDEQGGYKLNMTWGYEDWDFWVSGNERGLRAKHLAEPLFLYRVKAESMYTVALAHDRELRAQLVLNHPTQYPTLEVERAHQILSAGRPQASGTTQSVGPASLTHQMAADICEGLGCARLVDVGCFESSELLQRLSSEKIVGLASGHDLASGRARSPKSQWVSPESVHQQPALLPSLVAGNAVGVCVDLNGILAKPNSWRSSLTQALDACCCVVVCLPLAGTSAATPPRLSPNDQANQAESALRDWLGENASRQLTIVLAEGIEAGSTPGTPDCAIAVLAGQRQPQEFVRGLRAACRNWLARHIPPEVAVAEAPAPTTA